MRFKFFNNGAIIWPRGKYNNTRIAGISMFFSVDLLGFHIKPSIRGGMLADCFIDIRWLFFRFRIKEVWDR